MEQSNGHNSGRTERRAKAYVVYLLLVTKKIDLPLAESWSVYAKLCTLPTTCLHVLFQRWTDPISGRTRTAEVHSASIAADHS